MCQGRYHVYCHVSGKTLTWQQILCIPCSGNLENLLSKSMYLSQMVNELQCSPYSARGNNAAVYPATLLWSRSKIVENIADRRSNDIMALILKA